MRYSTMIILAVTALAAILVGAWFFLSPMLERKSDYEAQNELLDSIITAIDEQGVSNGSTEIPIYNEETETETDYETPTEPLYEPFVPVCETAYELAPESCEPITAYIPLDLADFPHGIEPLGILTIDSINLHLPVMEGIDEQALRIAPGRVPQTANIGEIGNAVIAGHRNFTFGSMFNRLGEVEVGNIIEFQAMNGAEMEFVVFEILEVLPENQIAFIQPQNQVIITLYTCTPIRTATHRLLIRAEKIEEGFN